jgi:peptidyl-prolyl cis-trans isomerase SurA
MSTGLTFRPSGRGVAPTILLGLAAMIAPARWADARVVEKIAAVVGEDIVLQSEVEERAAPILTEIASIANPAQRSARATAVRREVLDRLIDEHLITQQATELKLSVTTEEIDRSIEQVKKDNSGMTDAQLLAELARSGQTMESYRREMGKQLLRYRVLGIAVGSKITVSDTDVQNYYDRNMKSGANARVRASHIFISIPEDADTAAVLEKETLAKKLLERARGGEAFAKLAREFSENPATRQEGGDLGFFGRDELPKPIEELVFSMRIGEIRGPVRADRGFHIIKLVERRARDVKPLVEIREDLRNQLRQKEMERQTKNYLTELRRRTLVDLRM